MDPVEPFLLRFVVLLVPVPQCQVAKLVVSVLARASAVSSALWLLETATSVAGDEPTCIAGSAG